jgi:hypothetical protein
MLPVLGYCVSLLMQVGGGRQIMPATATSSTRLLSLCTPYPISARPYISWPLGLPGLLTSWHPDIPAYYDVAAISWHSMIWRVLSGRRYLQVAHDEAAAGGRGSRALRASALVGCVHSTPHLRTKLCA